MTKNKVPQTEFKIMESVQFLRCFFSAPDAHLCYCQHLSQIYSTFVFSTSERDRHLEMLAMSELQMCPFCSSSGSDDREHTSQKSPCSSHLHNKKTYKIFKKSKTQEEIQKKRGRNPMILVLQFIMIIFLFKFLC